MTNVRFNEGKLNALKASMEETESKMSCENGKLEQQKTVALQHTDGVQVRTKMKKAEIKNTIDKLEKKLRQQSRTEDNIDDIKEQLEAKVQAYGTMEAIVVNLTKTLDNVRFFFMICFKI